MCSVFSSVTQADAKHIAGGGSIINLGSAITGIKQISARAARYAHIGSTCFYLNSTS
jgi:hypothetical protein